MSYEIRNVPNPAEYSGLYSVILIQMLNVHFVNVYVNDM